MNLERFVCDVKKIADEVGAGAHGITPDVMVSMEDGAIEDDYELVEVEPQITGCGCWIGMRLTVRKVKPNAGVKWRLRHDTHDLS